MSEILLGVDNAKLGICYIIMCMDGMCGCGHKRETREEEERRIKRKRRSRRTMSLCHCVCLSYEQRVHS